MLVMLVAWSFLAAVTLPLGMFVMVCTGNPSPTTAHAVWVGLAVQILVLHLLALIAPLYPAAWVLMPTIGALAAVATHRELAVVVHQWRHVVAVRLGAIAILSLVIAYIAAGPITLYDSGLYHIQWIRWLARSGIVPGLGLLEQRFGIPSDWFAFAAALDAGALQGRMAACANAYLVLLVTIQAAFCCARVVSGRGVPGDVLLTAGFSLLSFHAVLTDTIVSASPDLPVGVLTVVVGWLMAQDDVTAGAERSRCVLIVFLASMTVALKLSAAPMLVIAMLYCMWRLRRQSAALLILVATSAVAIAPTVWASVVLSGCPAFPMTVGCLDLPWTVPVEVANAVQEGVANFGRWYASPPTGTGPYDWIIPYFFHPGNTLNPPLVALAVLSTVVVLVTTGGARTSRLWILALALSNFVFVMIMGPDTRFCIGAIALLFGLALTTVESSLAFLSSFRAAGSVGPFLFAMLGAVGLLVFRVAIIDRTDVRRWEQQSYGHLFPFDLHRSILDRFVLPVPLPVIYGVTRANDGHIVSLEKGLSGDVVYGKPPFFQCWGTNELCSAGIVAPLHFRVPSRGVAGGFIR